MFNFFEKIKLFKLLTNGVLIGILLSLAVAIVLGVWLLNRYYSKYERFTDGSKPSCVLYHADWCPHCVQFLPEWDAAADADGGNTCNWKKFEADKDKSVMSDKNITSFPTVRVEFPDGSSKEFTGDRKKEPLLAWVKSQV